MRAETRLTALLCLLVVSLMLLSLTLGHASINLLRIADILKNPQSLAFIILTEIRLPRTVLAPLVGAAFGLSGAAMQGLLRNPLADPSVLGAPQMAAFGAACAAFLLGIETTSPLLALYAIGFALLSVGLVALIGGRHAETSTLLIAGLALSSLASALLSLILALSKNPFALAEIVFWLIGSLEDRSWRHVWLAAPPILAGFLLILPTRRALSALVLGEEAARSLGLSLVATRWRIAFGVALAVGGAVAVTGAIGFVGLLAPHMVRAAVGQDAGRTLLPSACAGAALVLSADNIARLIPATSEIKVGMVTALVGVPVFILILLRHRARFGGEGV
jgi:iron complex transport system permease protein